MKCTQCPAEFEPTTSRQKRCESCRAYAKAYWARHSERYKGQRNTDSHRSKCRERNDKARVANNETLLTIFGDQTDFICGRCQFRSPIKRQFDLHHKAEKTVKFTRVLRNLSFTPDLIQAEGAELLCTNCHRKEHNGGCHAKDNVLWLASVGLDACQMCGLQDEPCVYEFHHVSPEMKSEKFSKRGRMDLEKMNCALICARCHRLIDSGIRYAGPTIGEAVSTKCHQRVIKEGSEAADRLAMPQLFERLLSDYTLLEEKFSSEHRAFIDRYEWLGTVGNSPLHTFSARIDGVLAGVVLFGHTVSKTASPTLLIQRGATASFAHRHLGSKLIGFALRQVKRLGRYDSVVAYSDPRAGEVGTLYSACNFKFLGWGFGDRIGYTGGVLKTVSPKSLRRTASLKKWYRETTGEQFPKHWLKPNGFKNVQVIPNEILRAWYDWGNKQMSEMTQVKLPSKGKWAYDLVPKQRKTKEAPKRGSIETIRVLRAARLMPTSPM